MQDAVPTTTDESAVPVGSDADEPVLTDADADAGADDIAGPEQGVLVRLQALPSAVFGYLMSDELAVLHKELFDRHGLSETDRDTAYYAELQAFLGEIPLDDFPDTLWNRLPWPEDRQAKATAFVIDLLGEVFLPAQAHLGDVSGLITDLGGDTSKYHGAQLATRRVTYRVGAKEIADAAVLPDGSEDARRRLAFIIESRLRHVREDAAVREMLMKSKKTGGMELSSADADKVMTLLAEKTRMTSYGEAPDAAVAPLSSEQELTLSAVDIKKRYSGTPEEQEAVATRLDRFIRVTDSDPQKMRDAFAQIIAPPDGRPVDPLYVVAGLMAMTKDDHISDALEQDDRYRVIVTGYLESRQRQDDLAAFPDDPAHPRYMNVLLQYLLAGVAGFDENNAARFALRAINALKRQGYDRYADLAEFDMQTGNFRWKTPLES